MIWTDKDLAEQRGVQFVSLEIMKGMLKQRGPDSQSRCKRLAKSLDS